MACSRPIASYVVETSVQEQLHAFEQTSSENVVPNRMLLPPTMLPGINLRDATVSYCLQQKCANDDKFLFKKIDSNSVCVCNFRPFHDDG
jgi:hypothetical protein